MKANRKSNMKKKKRKKIKAPVWVFVSVMNICTAVRGGWREGERGLIYRDEKDEIDKFSLCPGNLIE